MFQIKDVLRFAFFIFDKDKNGYIDKDELELFVRTLHKGGMQGNIMQALHNIDFNGDGKFDFMEFNALHEKFPTVLYPAFRLQSQMCSNVMGSQWWNKKKIMLANIREDEMRKLEKQRKSEQRKQAKIRNQGVRAEMGLVDYYSFHKKSKMKKRDYLERINPMPEVYIDKDNQLQTKIPDPIKKPGDEQYIKEQEEEEQEAKKATAGSSVANSSKNRFQAPGQ